MGTRRAGVEKDLLIDAWFVSSVKRRKHYEQWEHSTKDGSLIPLDACLAHSIAFG
jgi:hypothetical protein